MHAHKYVHVYVWTYIIKGLKGNKAITPRDWRGGRKWELVLWHVLNNEYIMPVS